MTGKNRIRMGITMGDPSGIGPEVIIKSFENPDVRSKRIIVIGDYNIMKAMYNLLKIRSFNLHRISNVNESQFDERLLNILDFLTPFCNFEKAAASLISLSEFIRSPSFQFLLLQYS